MKKSLIPALLFASVAFAPSLRNSVEVHCAASEIARTLTSQLFWHLWDELLTRELARPEFGNQAIACPFSEAFLKPSSSGSPSALPKKDETTLSIPHDVVRRTVERGFTAASEQLAKGAAALVMANL